MMQKIKLWLKWKNGRDKVIKRYVNLIKNFPNPPVHKNDEDFSNYSERVLKHLILLERASRLHKICVRYYNYIGKINFYMTKVFCYIIEILCCVAQIPGIIKGNLISIFGGIFCFAMLLIMIIYDLYEVRNAK